jgi:hypothetical protein
MSFNKKILAFAAAGTLTAATAVPAMALENEFHGMFQAQGIVSNLLTGTTGTVNADQASLHPSKFYVDQRARILYMAKANDDLKLVTHFEIDSRWGDNSYGPSTAQASTNSRNAGGAIGADEINLETKNVYLDFNCPITGANVKVGIQGWSDAYKGIFFGNDAAGLVISKKIGDGKFSVGGFRFDDARAASQLVGKQTRDFIFLDGAYNVTKDMKVGASYYYYNDDNSVLNGGTAIYAGGKNVELHMAGVNAAANVGPVTVDGFLLAQTGTLGGLPAAGNNTHLNAFAANLGVKAKVGVGTIKTSLLYTSGTRSTTGATVGGNSFITAQNETSAAFMESGVFGDANTVLLFRGNKYRTSNTDQSLVAEAGNKGAGVMAAFVGYDGAVGKTFFNFNAAFLSDAKKTTAKSTYVGTEVNAELGYKLYDNLNASVQAAYAILGPKYQGSNGTTTAGVVNGSGNGTDYANNPYLGRIVLSYAF